MFKRPQPKIDIQLQNRTKPGNLSFPHIRPTTPPSPDKGTNHFRAPTFARNKMMAVKTGEVIKELSNRLDNLKSYFPTSEHILARKELKARIEAAGFYEMEKQLQSIEEGINQDYFAEFRDFLLGKSKYNLLVHWGKRKLISDDIDKYLEATFNRKAEFDKKILKMKTTGFVPSNLDEAWFYFNFILKHPDITGEQIEEEFLKPWEAFYPQPLSKFQSQTPGADHDEESIPRMGGIPEHKEDKPAVSQKVLDVTGHNVPPAGLGVYVSDKADTLPKGIPEPVKQEPTTTPTSGTVEPSPGSGGAETSTQSKTQPSQPQTSTQVELQPLQEDNDIGNDNIPPLESSSTSGHSYPKGSDLPEYQNLNPIHKMQVDGMLKAQTPLNIVEKHIEKSLEAQRLGITLSQLQKKAIKSEIPTTPKSIPTSSTPKINLSTRLAEPTTPKKLSSEEQDQLVVEEAENVLNNPNSPMKDLEKAVNMLQQVAERDQRRVQEAMDYVEKLRQKEEKEE